MKRVLTTALAVLFLTAFGGSVSTAADNGRVAFTPHRLKATAMNSYYYRLKIVPYPRGFHPICRPHALVLWANLGGAHLSPFNFAGGQPIDVYVGKCNALPGDRMHVTLANAYGSMRIVPRPSGFALDSVDDSHTTITVTDMHSGATGTAESFVSY